MAGVFPTMVVLSKELFTRDALFHPCWYVALFPFRYLYFFRYWYLDLLPHRFVNLLPVRDLNLLPYWNLHLLPYRFLHDFPIWDLFLLPLLDFLSLPRRDFFFDPFCFPGLLFFRFPYLFPVFFPDEFFLPHSFGGWGVPASGRTLLPGEFRKLCGALDGHRQRYCTGQHEP